MNEPNETETTKRLTSTESYEGEAFLRLYCAALTGLCSQRKELTSLGINKDIEIARASETAHYAAVIAREALKWL
jgi:hypothetical protein